MYEEWLVHIDVPSWIYISINIRSGISVFKAVRFSLRGKRGSSGKHSKMFYPSLMSIFLPFSSFLPSQPAQRTIHRMSGVGQRGSLVAEGEGSSHRFSARGVTHTCFRSRDPEDQHMHLHVNFFPPIKPEAVRIFYFSIFECCSGEKEYPDT